MRHRRTGAPPVGDVTHVAERCTRRIEIVGYGDAVQVIRRALVIDDDSRPWIKHYRDREGISEGHTYSSRGPARGVLLVDLLYGNEEILTVLSDRRNGAVDEPDEISVRLVAGDVADEIDIVEDDQPARSGAGEADVGGQRVGDGEVLDRAISVDIDLRGRIRVDAAIDQAAEIGDATADGLRACRNGAQQRHCQGEQQEFDPVAQPHVFGAAASHTLVPSTKQFVKRDRGSPRVWVDWIPAVPPS